VAKQRLVPSTELFAFLFVVASTETIHVSIHAHRSRSTSHGLACYIMDSCINSPYPAHNTTRGR
jgi:hypothetical protein